jgi:integrase
MPKKAPELNALAVSRLKKPGLHNVGGVAGLALQVQKSGARSWLLRVVVGGKRREIGLGGFPGVTLAEAKKKAASTREEIEKGIDPIQHRREAKSKLRAEQAAAKTFKYCADAYIAAHDAGWKNAKHAQQWRNTLEMYAYPVVGSLLVSDVKLVHVMQILEPIWTTKTETASRLRGRIENVIDYAIASEYRSGDNPARWRGHIDKLLPARSKVAKVEHHTALQYGDIGAFMAELRDKIGTSARALEFAILTAARSGEVRGATWSEIDTHNGVWTIPADRMKAAKEHRIPLSKAALQLLKEQPLGNAASFIFPNLKDGALTDAALTVLLRRMGRTVTVHGFRSTFRDWAGETTAYPREVIEHALAHQLKDKTEAAYARGTLFDKRRRLMDDWARYCGTIAASKSKIVAIKKRR